MRKLRVSAVVCCCAVLAGCGAPATTSTTADTSTAAPTPDSSATSAATPTQPTPTQTTAGADMGTEGTPTGTITGADLKAKALTALGLVNSFTCSGQSGLGQRVVDLQVHAAVFNAKNPLQGNFEYTKALGGKTGTYAIYQGKHITRSAGAVDQERPFTDADYAAIRPDPAWLPDTATVEVYTRGDSTRYVAAGDDVALALGQFLLPGDTFDAHISPRAGRLTVTLDSYGALQQVDARAEGHSTDPQYVNLAGPMVHSFTCGPYNKAESIGLPAAPLTTLPADRT